MGFTQLDYTELLHDCTPLGATNSLTMSTPGEVQRSSVQYLVQQIAKLTGVTYTNKQLGIITNDTDQSEEINEEQFTDLDEQRVGIKPFFIPKGRYCSKKVHRYIRVCTMCLHVCTMCIHHFDDLVMPLDCCLLIIITQKLIMLLLLFAPNVKGEWVDSNFQIIDLVPPRASGVAGTLIYVQTANFATLQPWLHVGSFTCRIFNSLYTHKAPVLLCAPPRHRAI